MSLMSWSEHQEVRVSLGKGEAQRPRFQGASRIESVSWRGRRCGGCCCPWLHWKANEVAWPSLRFLYPAGSMQGRVALVGMVLSCAGAHRVE